MSNEERVLDYIDAHGDEIVAFMQKLIRTRSVTGDESEMGCLMSQECAKDGLDVEVVKPVYKKISFVVL